jgi:hypothetical protein
VFEKIRNNIQLSKIKDIEHISKDEHKLMKERAIIDKKYDRESETINNYLK